MKRFVAVAVTALVLAVGALPVRADDDLKADLQSRRAKLMSSLDAQTMFVAWSAKPAVYSRDVDYEYRQDSNMSRLWTAGLRR